MEKKNRNNWLFVIALFVIIVIGESFNMVRVYRELDYQNEVNAELNERISRLEYNQTKTINYGKDNHGNN